MGTRNLTAVFFGNGYPIAQYGQWDGYPEGQGIVALAFARDKMDRPTFEAKLRAVSELSIEERKQRYRDAGATDEAIESGFIAYDIAKTVSEAHPENSRDTGAKILELVQAAPAGVKLVNEIGFSGDSLFCEFAYVVDLNRDTFEVYRGFNKEPLDPAARFAAYDDKDSAYRAVRLLVEWPLDALPPDADFIAKCDELLSVEA